jgi:hypothetical protein
MRTLGGHRRFRASHVEAVLADAEPETFAPNGANGNGVHGSNGSPNGALPPT